MGVFVGGHRRPYRNGAGPKHAPICGVPFYLCIHTLTQNYQIGRVNIYGDWGGGLFLSGQPLLHPKGAGSYRSPIFGVPFYLR